MAFPEGLSIYALPERDFDPIVNNVIKDMLRIKDPSGENTAAIAAVARFCRLPRTTSEENVEYVNTYVEIERLTGCGIR